MYRLNLTRKCYYFRSGWNSVHSLSPVREFLVAHTLSDIRHYLPCLFLSIWWVCDGISLWFNLDFSDHWGSGAHSHSFIGIWMSSLMKCLLRILPIFVSWVFWVLLLILHRNSLCSLGMSPLEIMCVAPRHISEDNSNSKSHMHPNAHFSTIYNSQDTDENKMFWLVNG